MRIVVLYNEASEDATVAERDVLVQLHAVRQALQRLGHETRELACTLNLAVVRSQLESSRPDVVFNLVEALGGTDRLAVLMTLLLDALELPYTGSPSEAIRSTTNKLSAKERLRVAGLPTPAWFTVGRVASGWRGTTEWDGVATCGTAILKAIWEHASFGIEAESLLANADNPTLAERLRQRDVETGRPYFAEQFIEGREFNLSLLAGAEGPEVLPAAEIDFSAFGTSQPHIVGFRAKWDSQSFEFHNTPRRFAFPQSDKPLLEQLSQLARQCWELFDLRGYARVDFRVDREGRPWILEINTNPCLAPDAGFRAALDRANITLDAAIDRIVADACAASPARFASVERE